MRPSKEDSKSHKKPSVQSSLRDNLGSLLRRGAGKPERVVQPASVTKSFSLGTGLRLPDPLTPKTAPGTKLEEISEQRSDGSDRGALSSTRQHMQALAALKLQQQQLVQQQQMFHQQLLLQQARQHDSAGAMTTELLLPPKPKKADSNVQTGRTSIPRSGSVTDPRKFVTPLMQNAEYARDYHPLENPPELSPRRMILLPPPSIAFNPQSTGKTRASSSAHPQNPHPAMGNQPEILLIPLSARCGDGAPDPPGKGCAPSTEGGNKSSSGDTSNSSTDSVVFRPSSGGESDFNDTQPDHITSLRNKNANKVVQCSSAQASQGDLKKVQGEDHFHRALLKEGIAASKLPADYNILKPLQPVSSTPTPYALLRSLSTLSQASQKQPSSLAPERDGELRDSPPRRSQQGEIFNPKSNLRHVPASASKFCQLPQTVSEDHLKKFQKQLSVGNPSSGYLSDGEVMRSCPSQEVGSGYLSEGGATQYMRRIQQRFREGLLAVQESLEKNQSKADDTSLEDVSSISSSDISNAINDISTDDNVTYSSLSACSSSKESKFPRKREDFESAGNQRSQYFFQNAVAPNFVGPAAPFGSNSLPGHYRTENWSRHFDQEQAVPLAIHRNPPRPERAALPPSLSGKGRAVEENKQREAVVPSGGVYIKKGNQAYIVHTDVRNRPLARVPTYRHPMGGPGTAVAIDSPLQEDGRECGGEVAEVISRSLPNSGSVVNFCRYSAASRSASFDKDAIRRYFYPVKDFSSSSKTPSLLRQGLLGTGGQGAKKPPTKEGRPALDRSQSCKEQKDGSLEVANERPLSGGTYGSDGRREVISESDSFENFACFPYFSSSSVPRNWTIGGYGSSQFTGRSGPCEGQHFYLQLPYHLPRFAELSPGSTLRRTESNLISTATGARVSSPSLLSSSSSIYSSAEDKQAQEIRKLRRELEAAQEKVNTLSTQLNTNAHVVAAFEQSLSSMTQRLQHLTNSSHQKDSDLNELRLTIEMLKQQQQLNKLNEPIRSSNQPGVANQTDNPPAWMTSASSVSSLSSFNSATSSHSGDAKNKNKKKNWLRASFGKAFSRRKSTRQQASSSDVELGSSKDQLLISSMSTPTSPTKLNEAANNMTKSDCAGDVVLNLRQQLHEKDLQLTDVQLEALSSAHQLEQLYDVINRMKNEMASLKADNERLHRVIHHRGVEPSLLQPSPPASNVIRSDTMQFASVDVGRPDDRKVKVYVQSGDDTSEGTKKRIAVGAVLINTSTSWENLDSVVKKSFKEHLHRIQPNCGLGLSGDSVLFYQVGNVIRTKATKPELLPINCFVDGEACVLVFLKGAREKCVDGLSFETLIPKSIVQRYISLLLEHRRIILSGSNGTGKTFLAQKLARHVVLGMSSADVDPTSLIATFNVDHKSSKEVHQYLSNVAEQCQVETTDLPSVIILDNLHHVGSLADVFAGFFGANKHQRCPFLIGTMNQAVNLATTNLQLHHNFKWILCVNHLEPVKGFLGRFLRRCLVEEEVENFGGLRKAELERVVNWLPTIWQHVNKFLETNISSDITLGPRLFLSCPMNHNESQAWFTDLWNFSIMPYLLEAAQSCENKGEWTDPSNYVLATYPWNKMERPALLQLVSDDLSLDHASSSSSLWKEDKISTSSSTTVLHQKSNS